MTLLSCPYTLVGTPTTESMETWMRAVWKRGCAQYGNKHSNQTTQRSKMKNVHVRAFYVQQWSNKENGERLMERLLHTPFQDYICMRLVQHGRCKTKYRIYGVIVKEISEDNPLPSVMPYQGQFSWRYREMDSYVVKEFIFKQVISLKEPHERRQRLSFKVKGRVQYAAKYVKWLWYSEEKIESGNSKLLIKEFNLNNYFTEEETESGNCGFGRFPILYCLREDIK